MKSLSVAAVIKMHTSASTLQIQSFTPALVWLSNTDINYAKYLPLRITGWRATAEDREEWSKIVEQTKTHPGL
jgi:hypothetical protein